MASTTLKARYPRQVLAMVSDDMADTITRDALNSGRSKSEVVREHLGHGIDLARAADDAGATVAEILELALLAVARGTLREKATTVEAGQ